MGKHSNAVFTENTNTEPTSETNLLDETSCLTSQILISSQLYRGDEVNRTTDLTNIICESEETAAKIPKESIDLLNQYELPVCIVYL